eukprot:434342-Amphidinium_carterae.1
MVFPSSTCHLQHPLQKNQVALHTGDVGIISSPRRGLKQVKQTSNICHKVGGQQHCLCLKSITQQIVPIPTSRTVAKRVAI